MDAEADFPADLASAAAARRFAASVLSSWGYDSLIESAQLLISELVVNAVLHAESSVVVRLALEAGALRVEIRDRAAALPELRPVDPTAVTGRGLLIVDAVASRWGVRTEDDGKVVWFELAADDIDPAPVS
jgi:anti-sigma regulatory factor (Ser/Thr protein kinase)